MVQGQKQHTQKLKRNCSDLIVTKDSVATKIEKTKHALDFQRKAQKTLRCTLAIRFYTECKP